MGGGVFKFCSAVTEKSISSTAHSIMFNNIIGTSPSTTLHWPLLLAANSVVGCFLAALAIGYTFFLTWDKQMLNFLNRGDSKDHLILSECPDMKERRSLCDRCKNKGSSLVAEEQSKTPENSMVTPYRCCQVEYCCSNPTISHHKSHCKPHSHDAQFMQRKHHPCARLVHHAHSHCSQCVWDRDARYTGDHATNFMCPAPIHDSSFVEGRSKFWCESHQATDPRLYGIDRQHSYPFEPNHTPKLFRASIDEGIRHKPVNNDGRGAIKVCDDPICQRQQLRFRRENSSVDRSSLPEDFHCKGSQLSLVNRQKDVERLRDPKHPSISWANSLESTNFSPDIEPEHMYSNFFVHNYIPSTSPYSSSSSKRACYSSRSSSCPSYCECNQCSGDPLGHHRQTNWRRSSLRHGHKDRVNVHYFSDTEKSTATAFQTPQPSHSSLRNNYSTLPAKFSTKDSYFLQESRSNDTKREYKSCLNITETSVSSFDLVKPSPSRSNIHSWRNSSAPSIKIDEFDKRKLVKSVKFITPDDDADSETDSDSDYYVKKPVKSSIKKSSRDYLVPDGSSPIKELCTKSSIFREF